MKGQHRFITRLQGLYRGLFPRSIVLSDRDQQLLSFMFPTIAKDRMRFYDGMPWYMLHTFAIATALPAGYSRNRIHIYFRDYEPDDFNTLVTLIHEVFHAQQYCDLSKRRAFEFSFFRVFIWHYLGWFWSIFFKSWLREKKPLEQAGYDAYRKHPMEVPAYQHEADFGRAYRHFLMNSADLPNFFKKNERLVRADSGYGTIRPACWAMFFAMLISFFVTITKPLLELLLFFFLFPAILIFGKGTKK